MFAKTEARLSLRIQVCFCIQAKQWVLYFCCWPFKKSSQTAPRAVLKSSEVASVVLLKQKKNLGFLNFGRRRRTKHLQSSAKRGDVKCS